MKKEKDTLPVIIYSRRRLNKIRECIKENYGKIKYEFPFINALCVEMPKDKLDTVKHHTDVINICLDAKVSKLSVLQSDNKKKALEVITSNSHSLSKYSISEPLNAMKTTFSTSPKGRGVAIAIIDTGVSPHYDLVKPTNRIIGFKDFVNNRILPYDDDGHGTHVAGLAAGNGYLFGGDYVIDILKDVNPKINSSFVCVGTAPHANIVGLKALDGNGNGTTSDILAAMQWIFENHRAYNIKVANLSLGIDASGFDIDGDGINDITDPLVLGSDALVSLGITVVSAAGNSGPQPGSITSPGTSPLVITVGAADQKGKIPDFSSRGFKDLKRGMIQKPDLVAIGTDVLSCDKSTHKAYIRQSGTSMAAPSVAGAAACLYSASPKISPRKVKKFLMNTANHIPGVPTNAQGAGILNV